MRLHSTRLAALVGAAATTGDALRAGFDALLPGLQRCSAPGARSYEATFGRLLAGLYEVIADDLRRSVPPAPAAHVVDVGAGPGGLVVALARRYPQSRLTAVDIDPGMAERARDRVRREHLAHRVTTLVGDVGALPLPDGSADLITSSFSVHHWPDAAAGFAEIRRVLRPGGRAILYDLPDWWGRLETGAPRLLVAARAGGFEGAAVRHLAWPGTVRLVQRVEVTR